MALVKINTEDRLYVLSCGKGYTTLGFDFARKEANAVADWLQRLDLKVTADDGTPEAYAQYEAALSAGLVHFNRTGERCPVGLTHSLVGLEGKRVEVVGRDGSRRRFYVGKSTGWLPCHLEIARCNCLGGPAVIEDFQAVRVVR